MTHQRLAGSIEHALLQTVKDLSPAEIEAATGLKIGTFRKLSNPLNGETLDLDDAAALDAALIKRGLSPRFLAVFQEITMSALQRIGGAAEPKTDYGRSLRRLDIESGQLAKVIDDALADNHVDQDERRRIAKQAQNVIDHAREIRDAAEPPHAAVVPIRGMATAAS